MPFLLKFQEIMYMSFDNIVINYQHSNLDTKIEFKLKSIQIDNQIPLTPFPVVLCPATVDTKDVLHLSMVKSTKCIQYVLVSSAYV
jgi:hypothetical protein